MDAKNRRFRMRYIFDYLDYRDLLKEAYEDRKLRSSMYSYRMLAETLGLDTSNVFRVLQKDSHLPARCQSRAIEFLGLSGRAAEYFVLLITYGRERNAKAKQAILESALALRDVSRRALDDDELSYYSEWWVVALRSLLEVNGGRAVPSELARGLNPSISEEDVQTALELLQKLGLVKKGSSGRLVLTDLHLAPSTKPADVQKVRRYQKQILSMASDSMERFQPKLRDISTLTLVVDDNAFTEIREMLRECRRQIQKRVEEAKRPNRVMQLAMAFFPLSNAESDT